MFSEQLEAVVTGNQPAARLHAHSRLHVCFLAWSSEQHRMFQSCLLSQQDHLGRFPAASDFTLLALNSLMFDVNSGGGEKVRLTGLLLRLV